MGRSTAEIQEDPKKKVLKQINDIIDQAISRGKTFPVTASELADLEARGKGVREKRVVLAMRPAHTEQNTPVARTASATEMKTEVTRPALVAALKLAETFEVGSTRTLSFRKWIEAGRMA
jgi:hypothetical protein